MIFLAFILLAGGSAVYVWRDRPRRYQALVILAGLLAMIPGRSDLWEFGIWVAIAYIVDMAGDDAAPGSLLVVSALFYPLTALGFNPWWCQFGANTFGVLSLVAVNGMGGGILAGLRKRRGAGVDIMGYIWIRGLGENPQGVSFLSQEKAVDQ